MENLTILASIYHLAHLFQFQKRDLFITGQTVSTRKTKKNLIHRRTQSFDRIPAFVAGYHHAGKLQYVHDPVSFPGSGLIGRDR